MQINDIHRHITCEDAGSYQDYNFDYFIKNLSPWIGKSVVFLNPHLRRLYNCPTGHFYRVIDILNDQVRYKCDICGNISYQGIDPYRECNIKLLDECRGFSNIYPFLYLTLSDNTLQNEVDFFESHYKSLFWGIKVHPFFCRRKISDIKFNSHYPMIIHCGLSEYDHPLDIIKFAKRYSGNVVLAHWGRCEEYVLREIRQSKNIYIDTSPTYLPFQIAKKSTNRYFPNSISDVETITQLFENLINIIGDTKIIFGSDVPWGSDKEAMLLYEGLNLSQNQKTNIFQNNFKRFLGI